MLIFITSCQAMDITIAERCFLIDVYGQDGRKILPALIEFAEEVGLEPALSHPIAQRFIRGSKERARTEVKYLIGLGVFGSQLTLFSCNLNSERNLTDAFNEIVGRTAEERY